MTKTYSISELAREFEVTPSQAIGLTQRGKPIEPLRESPPRSCALETVPTFDGRSAFDAYRRDGLANRDCLPFACFGSRILNRETEALREAQSRFA